MSSDGNPLDTSNFTSSVPSTVRGARSSSTTLGAASTVRPRNRRLISSVEDGEDDAGSPGKGSVTRQARLSSAPSGTVTPGFSNLRNATSSSYSSRTPSPVPRRQVSRIQPGWSDSVRSNGRRADGDWSNPQNKRSAGFATDLLQSSWSSIQELASAVVGADNSQPKKASSLNGYRRREPSDPNSFASAQDEGRRRPRLPSAWGPTVPQQTQALPGSKEGRQAIIQSKKRELLLQANGDALPDSQGNYKRRTSLDNLYSSSGLPVEQDDGDTLVYIHKVHPNDSLTGVSIRYGCPLPVLRKANGFWPSDSIQSRKVVVLPVASCTLKGRRIPSNQGSDQLRRERSAFGESLSDNSSLVPDIYPTNSFGHGEHSSGLDDPVSSSIPEKESSHASLWTHESWVQADGLSSPVELGRVPKRTMGFFPRARRKSQANSETGPDLDAFRYQDRARRDLSPSPAPRFRDQSRSNSNSSSSPRHHQHHRSIILSGPGGVGTLDRNVTGPGPAPDKLNAFVKTHLPNLVIPPPPPQTTVSSIALCDRISFDSTSTIHSNHSTGGLENIGGAIEGWFRKVATKAKAGLSELQQPGQPHGHLGIGGSGDLIELDDASEGSRIGASALSEQTRRGNRQASSSSDISSTGGNLRGRVVGLKEMGTTKDV
ncbi:hypothetical protein PRK78_004806 [Emydomyces testavorans]|uniref:LysM domain-containing protein n=1 Tax=Emydomyces testavorans TaxID=2070801 RepID=A0AAF0IK45_9EURO|nr:hypothetical protein PRK78_004806 [Emydomyces testavorans]